MPGVQPADGVVLRDGVGEGLHVLLLESRYQGPDQLGLPCVREGGVLVLVPTHRTVNTRDSSTITGYLSKQIKQKYLEQNSVKILTENH